MKGAPSRPLSRVKSRARYPKMKKLPKVHAHPSFTHSFTHSISLAKTRYSGSYAV